MSFTPGDIAYFLEIARQQHFGRAARNLGLTQPAMTKAVRRLEAAMTAFRDALLAHRTTARPAA